MFSGQVWFQGVFWVDWLVCPDGIFLGPNKVGMGSFRPVLEPPNMGKTAVRGRPRVRSSGPWRLVRAHVSWGGPWRSVAVRGGPWRSVGVHVGSWHQLSCTSGHLAPRAPPRPHAPTPPRPRPACLGRRLGGGGAAARSPRRAEGGLRSQHTTHVQVLAARPPRPLNVHARDKQHHRGVAGHPLRPRVPERDRGH